MTQSPPPFFSVVLPVYNRAALVGRAVRSVLDQTETDWELLVVDDASTDETPEVLGQFEDPRIRILRNARNLERSASRNRGIGEALGSYICFLDSDDYYLPQHLATLRERIRSCGREDAIISLSVRRKFADRSVDILSASRTDSSLTSTEQVIAHHIPINTVAVPRGRLPNPAFDVRFHINEDVRLFAQLAASGTPILYFDEVTSVWFCDGWNTKCQYADYMTPQIECMRDLFSQPAIRAATRRAFRRTYLGNLYVGLTHQRCEQRRPVRAMGSAFHAAMLLRMNREARSAMGHSLYSFPGGRIMKRTVASLRGRALAGGESRAI